MPEDKNLYNLNQDQKQSVTRTWSITVAYSDLSGNPQEATASLTQEVFNDLDAMKDFMGNYYK
jgi:hypothetical protein